MFCIPDILLVLLVPFVFPLLCVLDTTRYISRYILQEMWNICKTKSVLNSYLEDSVVINFCYSGLLFIIKSLSNSLPYVVERDKSSLSLGVLAVPRRRAELFQLKELCQSWSWNSGLQTWPFRLFSVLCMLLSTVKKEECCCQYQ